MGSFGKQFGMSASTRVAVQDFWQYMGFVSNSFIFLILGLELRHVGRAARCARATLGMSMQRAEGEVTHDLDPESIDLAVFTSVPRRICGSSVAGATMVGRACATRSRATASPLCSWERRLWTR